VSFDPQSQVASNKTRRHMLSLVTSSSKSQVS